MYEGNVCKGENEKVGGHGQQGEGTSREEESIYMV